VCGFPEPSSSPARLLLATLEVEQTGVNECVRVRVCVFILRGCYWHCVRLSVWACMCVNV